MNEHGTLTDPHRDLCVKSNLTGSSPAQAMAEVGIDLSSQTPQKLTSDLARSASLLVTMGCEEACPHVPGLRKEDWPLPGPKGQSIEAVRETRDRVKSMVLDLLQREGWAP